MPEREIERTLTHAAREFPAALPSGFSDRVMRRIAEVAVEHRVPLLIATKLGFVACSTLAVAAALVIGNMGLKSEEGPPPSPVFGFSGMKAPASE